LITPLSQNSLTSFFDSFDFHNESEHIQKLVSLLRETAYCYQNIIHVGFNEENPYGFISLKITNDVDNIAGLLIEFLYVKPHLRHKNTDEPRNSYALLDYAITLALELQKQVAINHVYLIPINANKRSLYEEYGFENIPNSGKNTFEDYMVFNLLLNFRT
jgi:GNAT superfamily N-acetyltransferase